MVYRDDDIAMLRSEVSDLSERLEKFEALYKKEGIKRRKSMVTKFFGGIWDLIAGFFGFFKDVFTFPGTWVVLFAVGLIGGLGYFIYSDTQSREANQRAAQEAAATEAHDQCVSFCETHGYRFYDDRRGDTCYCGTTDSEDAAFIINVNTSENWVVAAGASETSE